MSRLYEYTGSISSIGHNEIMLYVYDNNSVPPTRLNVPDALFKYLSDLSGADSEEKYYEKIYRYNEILTLQEVEIPAKRIENFSSVPAKIVTQARFTSEEVSIFGPSEPMETPEQELTHMDSAEYARYIDFSRANDTGKFYYAN